MNKAQTQSIKLDSHVHFYPRWKISLEQLLNEAYSNLTHHASDKTALPVICLLDTGKETTSITEQLNNQEAGNWQTATTNQEPYSFWLKNQEKTMLLITGGQINTAEGLEVLVIGNQGEAAHGMPIATLLQQQQDGLLNVIPWAAGKWLSKRGQLLSLLLEKMTEKQFVLGDNAGRPRLWSNIAQLEYARANHIPVLCGSDPLPLPRHHLNAGSYGNLISVQLDTEKPWASIIQAIHQQTQINTFGQLSSQFGFIINQLKLRL